MSFDVLVIPADATHNDDLRRETISAFTEIQKLVGGFAERVRIPSTDGAVMYDNEDGIAMQLPVNAMATEVLRAYGERAGNPLVQQIRGTVLFAGQSGNGRDKDVPENFAQAVVDMFKWRDSE